MPFHNAALHSKNHLLRTIQRSQNLLEAFSIDLSNPRKGVKLCRWIPGCINRFKAAERNRGWLRLDNLEVNLSLRDLPDESDAAKCEHTCVCQALYGG